MNWRNRKLTQKFVALILIAALLQLVGVSIAVITFMVGVGLFVSYIARRAERKETGSVFTFYIAADEILRNEERGWYGFEIAEVINDADRVMRSMPDPPVLCYFAVGALFHRAGDHAGAVEYLGPLVDVEWLEKARLSPPSPQLRRYVEFLRELEREPSTAPQALGAVRSLERQRQKNTAQLIVESRKRLFPAPAGVGKLDNYSDAFASIPSPHSPGSGPTLGSIVAPPPIAEVLRDVYPDKQKSS